MDVCPDPSSLLALASGVTPPATTSEHVASCGACAGFLTTLAAEGEGRGELAPGAAVGRFTIVARLGAGGMGVVYTAHDPQLGRRVAIKVLQGAASASARARLLREAQALARLSHPNVVVVYEVGTLGEQVFLAMERVDGMTLAEWLAARPRRQREIVALFLQAGRGLEAAHAGGIVHRDFKPANVLVGHDGRVRVVDFGLAREAGPDNDDDDDDEALSQPGAATSDQLTHKGTVIGTPAYMSPEQRRGDRATRRSDQYSFTMALWEALAGARPPAPPLRRIPRALRRALATGLDRDPAARHPSMTELLRALERAQRPRLAIAAVALAAGAAAVAAAVGVSGAPRCPPAAGRLRGVWDEARRAGLADAPPALLARLDEGARAWAARADALCAARDLPAPLAAQRRACLDEQLLSLRAWVDMLATGDRALLAGASAATPSGDDLACDDPSDDVRPLPADAALRARVVELRAAIDAQDARARAGAAVPAAAALRDLVAQARATGFQPAVADALVALGAAQAAAAATAEARETFFAARDVSEEILYEEARAQAWVGLAAVERRLGRDDDARRSVRSAKNLLRAMPGRRARLLEAALRDYL